MTDSDPSAYRGINEQAGVAASGQASAGDRSDLDMANPSNIPLNDQGMGGQSTTPVSGQAPAGPSTDSQMTDDDASVSHNKDKQPAIAASGPASAGDSSDLPMSDVGSKSMQDQTKGDHPGSSVKGQASAGPNSDSQMTSNSPQSAIPAIGQAPAGRSGGLQTTGPTANQPRQQKGSQQPSSPAAQHCPGPSPESRHARKGP